MCDKSTFKCTCRSGLSAKRQPDGTNKCVSEVAFCPYGEPLPATDGRSLHFQCMVTESPLTGSPFSIVRNDDCPGDTYYCKTQGWNNLYNNGTLGYCCSVPPPSCPFGTPFTGPESICNAQISISEYSQFPERRRVSRCGPVGHYACYDVIRGPGTCCPVPCQEDFVYSVSMV